MLQLYRLNLLSFARANQLLLPLKPLLVASGLLLSLEAHFGVLSGWTALVFAMWAFCAAMLAIKLEKYPRQAQAVASWLDRHGIKLFFVLVSAAIFMLIGSEAQIAQAQFLKQLETNFCNWASSMAGIAGAANNVNNIKVIITVLINAVRILVVFIVAQGIVKAITAFQQQNEEWKELLVPVILTVVAVAVIDVITSIVGTTTPAAAAAGGTGTTGGTSC